MAGKGIGNARIVVFFFILLLAAQTCATKVSAADEELLKSLPGQWIYTDVVQEAGEEPRKADLAFLTFEKNGKMSLRCNGQEGGYAYSCEGSWSFELVPDAMDRLTLLFTSTDNPLQAGSGYRLECVYNVYAESSMENDTEHTYLILEETGCSGVSPFTDLYGYPSAALHREQGPNMRVVNCSHYVSLREKRSTASARLAKVPLGAQVLAFPEAGEENGFIQCVYHDEYGYILSEYLRPVE